MGLLVLGLIGLAFFHPPLHPAISTEPYAATIATLEPGELDRIQGHVRSLHRAIFEGDATAALSLADAPWIVAVGGRDSFRQKVESLGAALKAAAVKVEFVGTVFQDEPTMLRGDKCDYVIVPSICVVSQEGNQVELRTFDLGVRRPGRSDWKYVSGDQLDEKQALLLYPTLPSGLKFPAKDHRNVEGYSFTPSHLDRMPSAGHSVPRRQ